MQRYSAKVLGLALAGVLSMGATAQAESPVDVSLDVTPVTHYVWRGFDVTDGLQLPVQPSLTVGHSSGLSVNVWGSWALLDRDNTKGGDEIDYTIDYSTDINDMLSVSVGFIYYSFPNASAAKTSEIYVGAGYATMFSPSLTIYYDNDFLDESGAEATNIYISLGGGHSIMAGDYSIDLGASVGYSSGDFFDGLQDINLSAGTSIPMGPISLSPFAQLTFIPDDAVNADSFEIFGGVTASYGF